jgi:hypothetical protein
MWLAAASLVRERSDSLVVNLSRAIWRAAQVEMLEALLKAQGASTPSGARSKNGREKLHRH